MKFVLRASCLFGLFLLVLYGLCRTFDTSLGGQTDGMIKGVVYVNVLWLLAIWWVVGALLLLGFRAKSTLFQSLAFYTTSALATLLFLEGICWLLVSTGVLSGSGVGVTNHRLYVPPAIDNPVTFVGDVSPMPGRWRLPNQHMQLVNCAGDTLRRSSNELGALDESFAGDIDTNRVFVLGDSFMEGTMVNSPYRLSTLLSKTTGHRHLNFAMNGTSPINYWLTYRRFKDSVAHNAVLVGLLPANDFEQYNSEKVDAQVDLPIYRPYWTTDNKLAYSLANINQSVAAVGHTRVSLLQTIDSVYHTLSWKQKAKVHFVNHSYLAQTLLALAQQRATPDPKSTWYSLFSEAEWQVVERSLIHLQAEAAGKPIVLVSLPVKWDVNAFRNGAQNRLDQRMRAFCQQRGIGFISLVPYFLAYKGNLDDLYLSCDGHWTARGEALAAEGLLAEPAYRRAVGLK